VASSELVWSPETTLYAGGPSEGANFGSNLDVDGDTLIVAAAGDGDVGSAYVLTWDGAVWTEEAKLETDSQSQRMRKVAISGDRAVIVPATSSGQAWVHVFERDGGGAWSEVAELPQPQTVGAGYAYGVDVFGDTIVVTALEDTGGAGAAYVYVGGGATWTEQARITPSDSLFWDGFGFNASLYGDTLLVGAWHPDNASRDSSYVFVRDGETWSEQAILTPANTVGSIGRSVSLYGDTAMLSATSQSGAYIFQRTGQIWTEETLLVTPTLGETVSMHGDLAIMDCDAPALFVRSGNTWAFEAVLPATGMWRDVAVSGGRAFVGDWGDDTAALDGGAVTVYLGALADDGSMCTDESECASDFCVDGVCCDSPCEDGTCSTGMCTPEGAGAGGSGEGGGNSGGMDSNGGSEPTDEPPSASNDVAADCGCTVAGDPSSHEGLLCLLALGVVLARRRT
jgi:MYXO-CTERM domain-containing protein